MVLKSQCSVTSMEDILLSCERKPDREETFWSPWVLKKLLQNITYLNIYIYIYLYVHFVHAFCSGQVVQGKPLDIFIFLCSTWNFCYHDLLSSVFHWVNSSVSKVHGKYFSKCHYVYTLLDIFKMSWSNY